MLQARVVGPDHHSWYLSSFSLAFCSFLRPLLRIPTYGLSAFFPWSLFSGLYVRLWTVPRATSTMLSVREGPGTTHQMFPVAAVIHNGMSQRRHRRCVWAMFSVTALSFTSQMTVFIAPFAEVYVWRNKGVFGCRYVHNLPETVSRDLLWRNYAMQWSCVTFTLIMNQLRCCVSVTYFKVCYFSDAVNL